MWRVLGVFSIVAVIGFSIGGSLALRPFLPALHGFRSWIDSGLSPDRPPTAEEVVAKSNTRSSRDLRWSFDNLKPPSEQRLWALGRPVAPELRTSLEEQLADLSGAASQEAALDPMVVWLSSKAAPPARLEIGRFRQRRWAGADPLIVVATDESDVVRWVHVQSRLVPADALDQIEAALTADRHLDIAMAVDALVDRLGVSKPD